jgi:hypothetical protein
LVSKPGIPSQTLFRQYSSETWQPGLLTMADVLPDLRYYGAADAMTSL